MIRLRCVPKAFQFALLLLPLASLGVFAAGPSIAVQQSVWDPACLDKRVVLNQSGALVVTPGENSWSIARGMGKDSVLFLNKEGVSFSMKLSFDLLSASGDGKGDSNVFVGLCADKSPSSVQSADNVLGLNLSWSKTSESIHARLGRKERQGANLEARGDQWGNIPSLTPALSLPLKGASFTVNFKIDADALSVSIPEAAYSQSFPATQLDQGIWSKPCRLIVQSQNHAAGRAALSVSNVSISFPKVAAAKLRCLDLKPFANMGFKDETDNDGKGGWTDQGSNDLRYMPTGRLLFGSLPFDVIDPFLNNERSAIVLFSNKREFLPKSVGPIPVGAKASSLAFLHSAAWAAKQGSVLAGRYQVQYEDGSSVEIPVKVGSELEDWWSMKDVPGKDAALAFKVKSDNSASGFVGLYSFLWTNPQPGKAIRSITLLSAGGDPVLGVLAITLVADSVTPLEELLVKNSFLRDAELDFRKNPPDRDVVPDRIVLKSDKKFDSNAFSVSCGFRAGDGYDSTLEMPAFVSTVKAMGGVIRYFYGFDSDSFFWPYEIQDWYPVLGAKGGTYGAIQKYMYKGPAHKPRMVSMKTMLAACKKNGLRLILPFNCVGMFDGKDFIYVKTLPEDKAKKQSHLETGKFDEGNLAKIVERNATLVDYVIQNGYKDTVAYWEMGNERWDMPGSEYASVVAAHTKMLRSKIPDAKVIVCIAGVSSYSANMEGQRSVVWNRDLLSTLALLGMAGSLDYFAPHEYPFLKDNAEEITQNHIDDWCIRNLYRDLDYVSSDLDKFGFTKAKLYATEWGIQSDALGDDSRNDLLTSMAAGLANAKTMMAIYSHPRVEGGTIHTFLHASIFGRDIDRKISKWGAQSVFFSDKGVFVGTPVSESTKLFVSFATGATLVPMALEVPKGVNYLCAKDASGAMRYFAVNSTAASVKLPVEGVSKRLSLFSNSVTDCPILKYGSFGDMPGDIKEIVPREFSDNTLPAYSVSLLK